MSLPLASEPVSTNVPEWSVSDLAGALKRTVEDAFGHVRLRGEISGYRGPHASGHAYFCLKDRDARLDAVIWKGTFGRLRFKPQDGLEVVATGRITTFPGKSTYQIVVDQLEPAGVGALMALLDERRRTLAAEGLFAATRKRPLPFLPGLIGVVTSPTGAVIRDILHRLEDRFSRDVIVWPVRVQGETCAAEVAAAIAGLNALARTGPVRRPDVIIVARGGGSVEDLWGFNDEALVRAVVASEIPVVSAVGHETDWTLIDHAADLRVPTPTGAAELVVPVRAELVGRVNGLALRHSDAALRLVSAARLAFRATARALPSQETLQAPRRQRLDLVAARLGPALLANLRDHERRFAELLPGLARHAPHRELDRMRVRFDAQAGAKSVTAMERLMATRRDRLAELGQRLGAGRDGLVRTERLRLARCRERLDEISGRRGRAMTGSFERQSRRLRSAAELLASLGYRSVLARGFALVRDAAGRPVPHSEPLSDGQALEIEFADGRRAATVGSGIGGRPTEQGSMLRAPVRRSPGPNARPSSAPLVQPSLFDI